MAIKTKLLALVAILPLSFLAAKTSYANACTPGGGVCIISNGGTQFTNIEANKKYRLKFILHNRALRVDMGYMDSDLHTTLLPSLDLDAHAGETKATLIIGPFDKAGNLMLYPTDGEGSCQAYSERWGRGYCDGLGYADAYLTEGE